jgi:cation transport protein ChaC
MSEPVARLIDRDFLESGGLEAMVRRLGGRTRLWSKAQREESLRETLAARPPGPVWLFCYGSLIWNPMITPAARRRLRVIGWHRAFCLHAPGVRGTPENPALLLGLDQGGVCEGVALEIDETRLGPDLALIWRREMLTGSYQPRWVRALDGEGALHTVLTFVMDRQSPAYVRLDETATAARIAAAVGELGSNAEYLLKTAAALRESGIDDPEMQRLETRVTALLAEIAAPAPGLAP